jgi:hypothetical protein
MKNFFKRKKTYPTGKDLFKVLILDDSSDNIQDTLGITDERGKELYKLAAVTYHKYDAITDCYVDLCAICTHINEVVFVTRMLYGIAAKHNTPNIQMIAGGNIGDLLDDLSKRFGSNNPDQED